MSQEVEVERHYRNRFGPPTREAEFVPRQGPTIRVWKWDRQSSREGVAMYATLGASTALVADRRRCEFFIGLEPEEDEVAEALADVALEGVGTGSIPGMGDTITLAGPLWPGTEMRTFLFTSGGEQIIAALPEPTPVIFIQLVPLYAAEVDYKKKHGEETLWKTFRARNVPYWNPSRKSARAP